MNVKTILAILVCACFLAACGGGGGGGGGGNQVDNQAGPNDPPDIDVSDSKHAIYVSVSGVAADATVVLLLNDAFSISVTTDGVYLFQHQLQTGDDYRVVISVQSDALDCQIVNGVGVVGASDVSDIVVHCAARQKSWQAPHLIESIDYGDARYPALVMDENGNALAVWQQSNSVNFDIRAARYDRLSGWAPSFLVRGTSSNEINPVVAMNKRGDTVVVWQSESDSYSYVLAKGYSESSGWSSDFYIDNGLSGRAESPQVAIDDDGTAMAVWRHQVAFATKQIMTNRYQPDFGWGSPAAISGQASAGTIPAVALDGAGNALALWERAPDRYGDNKAMLANLYVPVLGWQGEEIIEYQNPDVGQLPRIAFDAEGNALAVWDNGADYSDIGATVNFFNKATGWGTSETLATGIQMYFGAGTRVITNPDGGFIVAWTVCDAQQVSYIQLANCSVANGCTDIQTIATSSEVVFSPPKIAINRQGTLFAIWSMRSFSENKADVWVRRYTKVNGWENPHLIRASAVPTGYSPSPEIALDNEGNAVAVWHHNDGNVHSIWAAEYK